ncbi:TetR family transcriptional regulator C-terminal domain-containing protein [Shimia gijangensis]|uniref:TetR family transcriptional regulator C-terminal domain-containing protein n=1 Tax=Shimia gijangensis TaxID=1470563 RepID=UPI001FE977F6|nr:TetR family transcriptional regulator C-terminal domain-containing protein [Shimia gijangensis]
MQLIEATITSISKHGISGTTLTSVTKEAGLSLGLVNFHFKSKEVLLTETLRFLAEEHRTLWMSKLSKSNLSPRDKLFAIVDAQFDPSVCSRKKLAVWFAFFGETAQRKSYRTTSSDIDMERQDVCADLFQQIITAEGHEQRDAEGCARALEGLFDGLWLNMLLYPAKFTRKDAAVQVRTHINAILPASST